MDNRPRRLPNLPIDQGVLIRGWRAQVSGGLKDRKRHLAVLQWRLPDGFYRHKTVIKLRELSDNICAVPGRTNAFFLKREEHVFIYDLKDRRLANGSKKRIRYRM
jgi:hypothetical protein